MEDTEHSEKPVATADDPGWGAATANVTFRKSRERSDWALKPVYFIHAFSAYSLITLGLTMLSAGSAPWWFLVLVFGAGLWAAVSAGAGWLMKDTPLPLPAMASLVVIAPITLAGWWGSLVLWANVVVFGLVYITYRSRDAEA